MDRISKDSPNLWMNALLVLYRKEPFNGIVFEMNDQKQSKIDRYYAKTEWVCKNGWVEKRCSYYENGLLGYECNYHMGKRNGLLRRYSKWGKLYSQKEYENGVLVKSSERDYRGKPTPFDKWPKENKGVIFKYPSEIDYPRPTDSEYYNDGLDMDQQGQEFWDDMS